MNEINLDIYVNGVLVEFGYGNLVEVSGNVNAPVNIIAGALNIKKRDVVFNIDTQTFKIKKNEKTLRISEESAYLNDTMVDSLVCNKINFSLYIPLKKTINLFGGSYTQNENEIDIVIN